jgi:Flp pilus assembly protein TadG
MKILGSRIWRTLSSVRRLGRSADPKSEEGTALVELAISLPIMLTLLTGAASFALAFYSLQQLSNATTTGVQVVAANQGLVSDPCATAASAVEGALPNWATTKLTFTMTWSDSGGSSHTKGPIAAASFSCTTAGDGSADTATALGPSTPVILTVSYTYSWLPIFKFTPSSALTSTEAALAY